ncbi:MAG: 2Fe-2S iron-sulfur cluster-binding protein [Aquificota bacterium]|nr:2Fe-2S iron-sulfur cluster-binding protein [Aquificaceae bacterium]HAV40513.1 hydroxyacid dehydrogenase [Aquificaceae bacterium]HCO39307.1 hydroxyacid dehydrogenase [Aquificaceae bacterium]
MKKVKIYVDGIEYEVEKNKPLLQSLLDLGIQVPYFCYHPRLKIIGACRMCIVFNEKTGRLMTSCNAYPEEGMSISTKHPLVVENQKYLLQAFMTRHPLDCPICDKAGECDLQNYGALFGPQRQIVPVSALEKERHQLDWESDFLEYYSNRCVVCYRCTRACDDVVGAHALYVEERGFQANIAPTIRPMDTSTCEMCGICVHVCPVGAIISKPFKYWTRSWLLKKGKTICNLCPVGCEVQIEYGVGDWKSKDKVYRTKPTDELNVCAKAFFGYDVLNYERLRTPKMFGKEETRGNLANYLSMLLKRDPENTLLVLSSYMSNEDYSLIKEVVKRTGAMVSTPLSLDLLPFLSSYGEYEGLSIKDLEDADFYVFIGEDITSTAPVLSYYTKKKVYKIGKVQRDSKLKPVMIEKEELSKLEGKGVIVFNAVGMKAEEASQWGKYLKDLCKEKGFGLVLLHDGNFMGLIRHIPIDWISSLPEALNRVKNLIIFGEDLLDYMSIEEVEKLFEKAEHTVAFSPFEDGIAQLAHIRVPMDLFGEIEGTYHTLMGEKKAKRVLHKFFDHTDLLRSILESLPTEEKTPAVLKGGSFEGKRFVHLYRSNWITKRSENLTRLYEKNTALEEAIRLGSL